VSLKIAFLLNGGTNNAVDKFLRSGEFRIKTPEHAVRVASMLQNLKTINSRASYFGFAQALSCACMVEDFDPSRLLRHARKFPAKFVPMDKMGDSLTELEKLYNHNTSDKMGLKALADMVVLSLKAKRREENGKEQ
jgi:hypothetical protein